MAQQSASDLAKREVFRNALFSNYGKQDNYKLFLKSFKEPVEEEYAGSKLSFPDAKRYWDSLLSGFEQFYDKLISGPVMKENGEPYSLPDENAPTAEREEALRAREQKICEDFISGKRIIFMDGGNLTALRHPDPNTLSRSLLGRAGQINNDISRGHNYRLNDSRLLNGGGDPPISEKVVFNAEEAKEGTYRIPGTEAGAELGNDVPRPRGLFSWLGNKLSHLLRGRPSAAWANYEAAQKRKSVNQFVTKAVQHAGKLTRSEAKENQEQKEAFDKNLDEQARDISREQERLEKALHEEQPENQVQEQPENQVQEQPEQELLLDEGKLQRDRVCEAFISKLGTGLGEKNTLSENLGASVLPGKYAQTINELAELAKPGNLDLGATSVDALADKLIDIYEAKRLLNGAEAKPQALDDDDIEVIDRRGFEHVLKNANNRFEDTIRSDLKKNEEFMQKVADIKSSPDKLNDMLFGEDGIQTLFDAVEPISETLENSRLAMEDKLEQENLQKKQLQEQEEERRRTGARRIEAEVNEKYGAEMKKAEEGLNKILGDEGKDVVKAVNNSMKTLGGYSLLPENTKQYPFQKVLEHVTIASLAANILNNPEKSQVVRTSAKTIKALTQDIMSPEYRASKKTIDTMQSVCSETATKIFNNPKEAEKLCFPLETLMENTAKNIKTYQDKQKQTTAPQHNVTANKGMSLNH